ncbi:MAG TPA: hypothetical protein VMF08_13400 [Candidatus Sulfotelmatobacter sp.]|nr:hypothetical protein [Candidatus Sulfotelmatobacter sp.]
MPADRTRSVHVWNCAASAGNDHHPAAAVQFQQLTVDARVFPAGVVNELSAMHMMEDKVFGGFDELAGEAGTARPGDVFGSYHESTRCGVCHYNAVRAVLSTIFDLLFVSLP